MAGTVFENVCAILSTVVVVSLLSFAWRLWTLIRARRHYGVLLRSFPTAPGGHWLFGHAQIGSGQEEAIQHIEALTHTFSHYYVHSTPAVSFLNLVHPDTIKTISSTPASNLMTTYGFLKEWIGEGLLISTGKKWKRSRRLLTPVFHFGMLKPYVKAYNDCTHVMLDKWRNASEDEPVELFEHATLLTLDILLQCLFGTKSNCQLESGHKEYITGVRRIALLLKKRIGDWKAPLFGQFYYYYLTSDGYHWRRTLDMLHRYSRRVINQRRVLRENGQAQNEVKDFLDLLLDAKDDDGNGITDEVIQDEVDTFLFEGHDTTASGISWFLYNLARHPEYQEKCRQEIDILMNKSGKDELDWNDVQSMTYTTMCLKESLRFHAPVQRVTKRITVPLHLSDGKVIQPGTLVGININSLHHNPHVWDNPEVYDPDRFSKENINLRPSHAFIPFSAGPRNCIGQKFAMDEMKVIAALTLRHFEMSVDGCPKPRRRLGIVLRADNGIHIKLKPRNLQRIN